MQSKWIKIQMLSQSDCIQVDQDYAVLTLYILYFFSRPISPSCLSAWMTWKVPTLTSRWSWRGCVSLWIRHSTRRKKSKNATAPAFQHLYVSCRVWQTKRTYGPQGEGESRAGHTLALTTLGIPHYVFLSVANRPYRLLIFLTYFVLGTHLCFDNSKWVGLEELSL